MNTKEFIATWVDDDYINPKRETVDARFFYADNGYDENARRIIDSLIVGEIKMVGIGHSIRRVR